MSLHFKNPEDVSISTVRIMIGQTFHDDEWDVNSKAEDYDVEIILTPKFKPGWYAHKSSNNSYEVRFFEDDPETMFGQGSWHRTTEPKEIEK